MSTFNLLTTYTCSPNTEYLSFHPFLIIIKLNSLKQQLIFIFLLVGTIGFGQGMVIHAGGTSMKNGLKSITPEGTTHTGYHIGADGRLGDDGFYFLIGLQYHKLDFIATEGFSFSPTDPNLSILKGKGGFAFKLFQLNDQIVTRFRVLGTVDYLLNLPTLEAENQVGGVEFNDAVAGLGGGLEVDIYFLTLNFEYNHGFFKSVKETPDSSLNFLTCSLGVNF